ncbi:hypothetical protein BDV19DRAFT_359095 [Aspergillus venezuelensis]
MMQNPRSCSMHAKQMASSTWISRTSMDMFSTSSTACSNLTRNYMTSLTKRRCCMMWTGSRTSSSTGKIPDIICLCNLGDDTVHMSSYKPVGRNFGGLAGKKDGFETYAVPADGVKGLHGNKNFPRPAVIDKHMSTLQEYTRLVNTAKTIILASLSTSLCLPQNNNLVTCHRPDEPSPDIIRLLKYHAQVITERGALHTPHTDLGSLTFLFARQPGLQILAPNSEQWTWVEPREDCAIVNLGDMMALLTNGYLKSCLHRVGPLPGQAMPERYSFAYLARAENWTPMTGLRSPLIPAADDSKEVLTSGDWIKKKFGSLRLESRREEQDWVLTGKREALPV